MSSAIQTLPDRIENEPCLDIGEFRRLRYFYGQLLGAQDMRTEQNFFREKLNLHNHCLHGYGVVCGLLVEPVPFPQVCKFAEEEEEKRLRGELEHLQAQKGQPGAPADLFAQIEALRRKLDQFYERHCGEAPRTRVRIQAG